MPISPHYAIVALWYELRHEAKKHCLFIEINDYIIKITPEGVVAGLAGSKQRLGFRRRGLGGASGLLPVRKFLVVLLERRQIGG